MCKMFVVNSLYLGNRSLGLELWDGKGVVEMTEKQVRDGIHAGKEIYGLIVAANGMDLDIDTEGFYMNNLVIHRHIGNYQPMFDTENPVSIMYIVTGMREVNGAKEYDLISSRFETKAVTEDMLKSLFLMGAVCGGARMDGDRIILAPQKGKDQTRKGKEQTDNPVEAAVKIEDSEKRDNTDDNVEVKNPSTKAREKKTSKK